MNEIRINESSNKTLVSTFIHVLFSEHKKTRCLKRAGRIFTSKFRNNDNRRLLFYKYTPQ
jgi:hypothetical protein